MMLSWSSETEADSSISMQLRRDSVLVLVVLDILSAACRSHPSLNGGAGDTGKVAILEPTEAIVEEEDT
jgi:hypothetical protein